VLVAAQPFVLARLGSARMQLQQVKVASSFVRVLDKVVAGVPLLGFLDLGGDELRQTSTLVKVH
jgi:hypothetical protein